MAAENDYDADEEERFAYRKRLKAAVHYTVGQIGAATSRDSDISMSKAFIAVVAEATCKQLDSLAKDLELFAKHAKRTTINPDDVKLAFRKTPKLMQYLDEFQARITDEKAKEKPNERDKPPRKKRKKKDVAEEG